MIRLRPSTLEELSGRLGGSVQGAPADPVEGVAPVTHAGRGELAPLTAPRFTRAAQEAAARGAYLLVEEGLLARPEIVRALADAPLWIHPYAAWALAEVLDAADAPEAPAVTGAGVEIGPGVVLGPRVVVGARVRIGANSVIGRPGFGWAHGPRGAVRAVPQLGGVILEDDVEIGPLCTVDAGTLGPTLVRRGAKLDAHVHVGHNCDVGEGTLVAAQSGFAGSVTIGKGVLVGGQVGIADHITVGDGARIAAKSGIIGDVPPGAVVAGYPAVPRARWLRALAKLYRGLRTEDP